jgi:hypothetical protein
MLISGKWSDYYTVLHIPHAAARSFYIYQSPPNDGRSRAPWPLTAMQSADNTRHPSFLPCTAAREKPLDTSMLISELVIMHFCSVYTYECKFLQLQRSDPIPKTRCVGWSTRKLCFPVKYLAGLLNARVANLQMYNASPMTTCSRSHRSLECLIFRVHKTLQQFYRWRDRGYGSENERKHRADNTVVQHDLHLHLSKTNLLWV